MDKMTHREKKTKQGGIYTIKNIVKELQEKYYTFLDYTKNEGSAWKINVIQDTSSKRIPET